MVELTLTMTNTARYTISPALGRTAAELCDLLNRGLARVHYWSRQAVDGKPDEGGAYIRLVATDEVIGAVVAQTNDASECWTGAAHGAVNRKVYAAENFYTDAIERLFSTEAAAEVFVASRPNHESLRVREHEVHDD